MASGAEVCERQAAQQAPLPLRVSQWNYPSLWMVPPIMASHLRELCPTAEPPEPGAWAGWQWEWAGLQLRRVSSGQDAAGAGDTGEFRATNAQFHYLLATRRMGA